MFPFLFGKAIAHSARRVAAKSLKGKARKADIDSDSVEEVAEDVEDDDSVDESGMSK